VCLVTIVSGGVLSPPAGAQNIGVGVEQHLGAYLPLDELTFTDEDGRQIVLKELFDRPVVLTLVYFRCPGICTPLLNEVARISDVCDLVPGKDYRLVTISFDPSETPDLARRKKENLLATMNRYKVPADGWRFLVGDERNIKRITDGVGFRYMRDRNKVDFIHSAAVIFISKEGEISRYLTGVEFNPPDWKMAVLDATAGNARSFMQSMQKLCYAYDPTKGSYILAVDRIVLGVSLLVVVVFVIFLVRRKPGPPPAVDPSRGNAP